MAYDTDPRCSALSDVFTVHPLTAGADTDAPRPCDFEIGNFKCTMEEFFKRDYAATDGTKSQGGRNSSS